MDTIKKCLNSIYSNKKKIHLINVTYVSEWEEGFIIKNNIKYNPNNGIVYYFPFFNENNTIIPTDSRTYIILENGEEILVKYSSLIGNYKAIR